jgi:hypothetical protein
MLGCVLLMNKQTEWGNLNNVVNNRFLLSTQSFRKYLQMKPPPTANEQASKNSCRATTKIAITNEEPDDMLRDKQSIDFVGKFQ